MQNRRKVLFVIPSLFGGGAERVFTHVINNLDRERFEPFLALGSIRGTFLDNIKKDVVLYELAAERARKAIPPLLKLIWQLRPQTVATTLGMNFAASLAKPLMPRGTRLVLREGSSPTAFLAHVARKSPTRAKFYRQCYKYIYGFADAIICQSDFMRDDIQRNLLVPAEKLRRIYNPVDFRQIDILAAEPTEDFFDGDAIRLISVGKLGFEKAYDVLLRAFALVREVNPTATLTLLGEGADRKFLEDLAQVLDLDGSVRFPGFLGNPYSYMKRADIFISSSRYEGFSNVIVESLACGTPVVATDCPSAVREVIEEGVNGWFAKNENVESLAQTINRAILERKNLKSDVIRQSCESRFALERILPQYEKQYEA
jgi:glycosyltransferase involved in cell wall biosynthesis